MLELKDFHFSLWLVVTAMYVYKKMNCPSTLSRAPPPMGNRNRPIVPSTVLAGPIARRGGGGMISFSVFVVSGRSWVFT